MSEVLKTILLRTFAFSLISLFIPLYFMNELGISFRDVLIYYIVLYLAVLVFYPISAAITYRLGVNKTMALSIPFFLLYFFLLYNLNNYNISLALLAIIIGGAEGIFWFAFNGDFAQHSDTKHSGEVVKFWFVFAALIGIIGPFIGGMLLGNVGFHLVFIIVSFVLILSVVPLFRNKGRLLRWKVSFSDFFRKEYWTDGPQFIVQGMRGVANGVFWPLFIFFILKEYFKLGVIFSVTALVASISTWYLGKVIDKVNKSYFAKVTTIIDGVISATKAFVSNIAQILGVTLASGVSFSMAEITLTSLAFDASKKSNVAGFFIFREIMLAVGRMIFLFTILFSGLDVIGNLKLGFLIITGASLLQGFFK